MKIRTFAILVSLYSFFLLSTAVILAQNQDATVNWGVFQPKPWYQTADGDVHAQGDIRDSISANAAGGSYLSLITNLAPGVVSQGSNSDPDMGGGWISSTGWFARKNIYPATGAKFNYKYFKNQLVSAGGWPKDCAASVGQLNSKFGILRFCDDTTVSIPLRTPSGKSTVAFVNGNLTLNPPANRNIEVEDGGFLAFIVSGNITVSARVGDDPAHPNAVTPDLEGVYISDKQFIVQSSGDPDQEKQLVVRGMVIAWGGVQFQRDLEGANNDYPAEYFIYDPALVRYIHPAISYSPIIWRQLPP